MRTRAATSEMDVNLLALPLKACRAPTCREQESDVALAAVHSERQARMLRVTAPGEQACCNLCRASFSELNAHAATKCPTNIQGRIHHALSHTKPTATTTPPLALVYAQRLFCERTRYVTTASYHRHNLYHKRILVPKKNTIKAVPVVPTITFQLQ